MSVYQRILNSVRRLLIAGWPLLIPFSVVADETEIFYQADTAKVNTNVLFLLDSSGSMDQILSNSGGKTRMQVLKEAFREIMLEAPSNLNIGLMNYANAEFLSSYHWDAIKGVSFPISPVNSEAAAILGNHAATDNLPDAPPEMPVREFVADIVDSWQPIGYTPIVDSLYEAARYFRGEESVWGKYPPAYHWAAHPASYTGTPTCENPQPIECRLEWGECNGTQTSCEVKPVSSCCNWVQDASGADYCANNDYSCSTGISHCQHTVCDRTVGSATYHSPLEHSCQANFLVLMSDGKPEYPYYIGRTSDGSGKYPKSAYPNYLQDTYLIPTLSPTVDSSIITTSIPTLINGTCVDRPSGYASGTCGAELTHFMANNDQSDRLAGTQTVETFTVAYGMADEPNGTAYLASLATAENGVYTADSAEELVAALKDVFSGIEQKSYSFSSPSLSVNENSLFSHSSDVYIPIFNSQRTPLWSGNLRKFRLSTDNTIVGVGGSAALTSTGEFAKNAQDLWSTNAHGSDVSSGGAASRLPPPAERVRRTDVGDNRLVNIRSQTSLEDITPAMLTPNGTRRTKHALWDFIIEATGLPGRDGLSRVGWYIDCEGNKVTVGTFLRPGMPVNIEEVTTCSAEPVSIAKRDILLDYALGYEKTAEGGINTDVSAGRQHMGDILNSKPVVVNYPNKSLVFIATNEGYLHALNADTGVEEWAFMPSELLKNQLTFFEDKADKVHVYGIDGALTLWNHDADKDGVISDSIDSKDKRLLFFGLRRGGDMYYALDITSPSSPSIAWKISPATDGFRQLGETWSKPTLSKMRIADADGTSSESKYVLVFGGGYDAKYDEQNVNDRASGDALGANVYIVDAETGSLLWSAKGQGGRAASAMTHSVAGDIRVLDMDNNGELDRLYFADLGGNVWRADLAVNVSSTGIGTGSSIEFTNTTELTKLAALGNTGNVSGTDGDHRKFFYEPDTALRMHDGEIIMTVSIGSGYRTHPLDLGDNDNFYVLIDRDVFRGRDQSADAVITPDDLLAANPDGSGLGDSILTFPDKKGWYMPLQHRGEKVLATSLTFLDKILFTSFAQADASGADSVAGPCTPLMTTSRAYVLDLMTGEAVANLNRVEITDEQGNIIKDNDPFVVAGFGEILDTPQLIFSKLSDGNGGSCTKTACQQNVIARVGKLNVPILDLTNTTNTADTKYSEMVDLTILPRLYWRDKNVSLTDTNVVRDEDDN